MLIDCVETQSAVRTPVGPDGTKRLFQTLRAFPETGDVAAVRRKTEEILDAVRRARVALRRTPGGRLEIRVQTL